MVILTGYTVAFSAWVLLAPDTGVFNVLSNLGGLLGGVMACVMAWTAALDPSLHPQLRRSWRWLSASLTVFCAGDAFFLAEKVVLRGGLVGGSPADVLYLASYPLAAMALLTASGWRPEPDERTAFWLDAAMMTLGAAALAWHVFVRPTLAGRAGTEDLTAVAYVLCDLALLLLLAIAALRRGGLQRGVVLLGAALVVRLGANGLYWYDVLLGPPGWIGRLAAMGYNVAWLSFALAAWSQVRDSRRRRRGVPRMPAAQASAIAALPTLAAAVGYVALAASLAERWTLEFGFMLFAGVGLTAAVLARQMIAIREAGRATAERAALANEARFRSLVENASDIVLVVGGAGEIRYHTPSAERFFGRDADGLDRMALAELVHPEDRALVAALLDDAVRRPGSTPAAEWRLRWSDRSWRVVEGRAKSVPDDPNLGGVILTLRSVHERKQLEERLVYQAFHDPLTNLANRVLLAERLEHALARSKRAGERVTVLFVDLDDFKNVNDTLGHATGDQLLVELSRRLLACVRSSDTTARLGGDEFAVLVEEGGLAAAHQVAQRVGEAVRRPFRVAGRDILLGASIGLASSDPGGDTAGDLLRNADIAMYRAKHSGKGRLVVFEAGMQAAVHQRLELEAELRTAVAGDELQLVYQPIVDLASGATVGAEALLRWRHPSRGELSPAEFLDAAEAAGVMPAIGRWTVETACAFASSWPAALDQAIPPMLCVNVAPRLLASPEFARWVEDAVVTARIPQGRLVLEVTEGAAVEDGPATFAAMRAMRARGVRFAIDDFGTGYSSLSYLREMPVDILKLDKLFVEGLAGDPQACKLARGILDLARALGKWVVAEGVEQEEQAARLRALGCQLAQGFHFSRAVGGADVLDRLRRADA